jgi:hypothetical protein
VFVKPISKSALTEPPARAVKTSTKWQPPCFCVTRPRVYLREPQVRGRKRPIAPWRANGFWTGWKNSNKDEWPPLKLRREKRGWENDGVPALSRKPSWKASAIDRPSNVIDPSLITLDVLMLRRNSPSEIELRVPH